MPIIQPLQWPPPTPLLLFSASRALNYLPLKAGQQHRDTSDLLGSPECLKAEPLASQNQKRGDGGRFFFSESRFTPPPLSNWNSPGKMGQVSLIKRHGCLLNSAERA